MNLLEHSEGGATIHLEPRELLMVMALIQEGRCAFECESDTGQALDNLFCSAVVKVETARRDSFGRIISSPQRKKNAQGREPALSL